MKVSAVLFDADGVVTLPEEVFSVVYTRSHGLDYEPFEHFFKTEWRDFVTGKRDLKEAITRNPELWQWKGDADSLLNYWFKIETPSLTPGEVVFFDDDQSKIDAALSVGINARLYQSIDHVKEVLSD